MSDDPPFPVSGYVLAGGKSTRMGRDKALLELAGEPLIAHALAKLSRLCADLAILSANPALAAFAPLAPDLHPGCGPLGGIEAALAHAAQDWCLILPVDVPFLPYALLEPWVRTTLSHGESDGTRLSLFVVDGKPQPALMLIHRDLAPYISAAIARGDFKLLRVLAAATGDLASTRSLSPDFVFRKTLWNAALPLSTDFDPHRNLFANLNTPEDFARAAHHTAALDRTTS